MVQFHFALLLAALATVRTFAQTTGQEVAILVGAGCKFSNYSALPKATPNEPSYSLELNPGLGKGIYVLHFTQFNLPEADVLIVRASGAPKSSPPAAVLSGKNATGKFYSTAIAGSGVEIELLKAAAPTTPPLLHVEDSRSAGTCSHPKSWRRRRSISRFLSKFLSPTAPIYGSPTTMTATTRAFAVRMSPWKLRASQALPTVGKEQLCWPSRSLWVDSPSSRRMA